MQHLAASLAVDTLFDAVLVLNERREVLARWESSRARIGAPEASVVGSQVLERLHPDDLLRVFGAVDGVLRGDTQTGSETVRVRHPTDAERWLTMAVELIDGRTSPGIGGVVVLGRLVGSANEPAATALVEAVPFGVAVLDASDVVLFANDAFTDLTGLRAGPVLDVTLELAEVLTEIGRVVGMARAGREVEGSARVGERKVQVGARLLVGPSDDVVVTVTDITRRLAVFEARSRSERTFAAVFEHSPTGIAIVSLEGEFLRVNDAFCTVCGRSGEELLRTTFDAITHPDDIGVDVDYVVELLEGLRDSYRMEKRYLDGRGEVVWVDLRVAIVRREDGHPLHFLSQIVDITDRKHAEDRAREREADLTHQATHDHLTGLPNRVLFDAHLAELVRDRRDDGEDHVVLLCDLDRFKPVNDRYGHSAGDAVLRTIANRLSLTCRQADLVARLGGDEFGIVASDRRFPDGTTSLAERVIRACSRPVTLTDGAVVEVGMSIGIARLEPGRTIEGVKEAADAASYRAKAAGGGVAFAD